MTYAIALQAPNRQQWEPSSQYSQSWNCGPTCVSFIAGFYRDSHPAIEYNRRLIAGMGPYYGVGATPGSPTYGCPARTPTNAQQQSDMLTKRGVPNTARQIDGVAQLHGLVDSGRRPTLIGIEMSRVPASVRGHSFTGWHAVVAIAGATVGGVRGFWVMDPNFPAGASESRRFYSDAVMQSAWANNTPRWCVVPNDAKPTAAPPKVYYCRFNAGVNGVNIRRAPDARVDNVFAVAYSDANPLPNGVKRKATGAYLGRTDARRVLKATVRGPDGQTYFRFRLPNTTADVFCNARFMHRVYAS